LLFNHTALKSRIQTSFFQNLQKRQQQETNFDEEIDATTTATTSVLAQTTQATTSDEVETTISTNDEPATTVATTLTLTEPESINRLKTRPFCGAAFVLTR
jgi:hypothetical protein